MSCGSIDPPGSGLHGLLEQGPEAAITPGASPSSPDGMTPFDGDRKPKIIITDRCADGCPFDPLTPFSARPLGPFDPLRRFVVGSVDHPHHACPAVCSGVVRYIERSPGDSIAEGIGIDRVTANFSSGLEAGCIDGCLQGNDRESVE